MLAIPDHIAATGVVGCPLEFRWSEDIALKLYAQSDLNMKLHAAIDSANYRSKMAIAAWMLEWLAWRFDGLCDLSEPLSRAEAAWAAVIDPLYARGLDFELSEGIHAKPSADGVLEIGYALMEECYTRYRKGSIFLAKPVVKLATLVRHVVPKAVGFDEYLSQLLARISASAPRLADYDRSSQNFDFSAERAISRSVFEGKVTHGSMEELAELEVFLEAIAVCGNPHIATSEIARSQ